MGSYYRLASHGELGESTGIQANSSNVRKHRYGRTGIFSAIQEDEQRLLDLCKITEQLLGDADDTKTQVSPPYQFLTALVIQGVCFLFF